MSVAWKWVGMFNRALGRGQRDVNKWTTSKVANNFLKYEHTVKT